MQPNSQQLGVHGWDVLGSARQCLAVLGSAFGRARGSSPPPPPQTSPSVRFSPFSSGRVFTIFTNTMHGWRGVPAVLGSAFEENREVVTGITSTITVSLTTPSSPYRSSAYNTSVATARLDSRQFDVQLNSQQLGAHGWYARQCPSLHLGEQGGYRGVITAITVITAIITSIIITTVIISTLADLGRSVLQQLASARDSRQLDPGRAA